MKRFLMLPVLLCGLISLISVPTFAQDIILLNQDGEKVGVAKDVDRKKDADAKKSIRIEVDGVKSDGKKTARIENGVVTIINADGTTQEFKLSDARSVTITRSSNTVVDQDGNQKVEAAGKAIVIGPDGVRREISLGDGGTAVTGTFTATKTWMIGVSCSPASSVLRSQLQLGEDAGLVVNRVLEGGAAEKAGLLKNDILMYGDQNPIANQKELSKIVNEAGKDNREIVFTILRRGEEVSVSVKPTEREGISQMFQEFGPGMGGFGLSMPGIDFGGDFDFEFKQFGPGVIIGKDRKDRSDVEKDLIGDFEDRMKRMQEQMEELRRQMRGIDRN